jgi:hypothetical protein
VRVHVQNLLLILCYVIRMLATNPPACSTNKGATQRLSRRREYTALHEAALRGHTAVCELLIANKADVNATDWCAHLCSTFVTDFVLI